MDLFFRIAILTLGYLYPAYKCFKLIDGGKPKYEQLYLWCQHWVVIAVLTGCERIADMFVSWFPFYSAMKLVFVIYLWHPDTKGAEHIYQAFIKPLMSNYIESMDLNPWFSKDETAKMLVGFWTKWMCHLQSDVLQVQDLANAEKSSNQDNVTVFSASVSDSPGRNLQDKQGKELICSKDQPQVMQSAIWLEEQKLQPKNYCSSQSLTVFSGQQQEPTQLHNCNASASQPVSERQTDFVAASTISEHPITTEEQVSEHPITIGKQVSQHPITAGKQDSEDLITTQKQVTVERVSEHLMTSGKQENIMLNKEETDFELVSHPTEVLRAELGDEGKRVKSRWWW
ncbi:hypothetical protein KP509_24G022100 [Ceratopteris richardii]|uniref:HVA22-like protein n=1 Tax=Ceratopteris richardii TaxID=49495 RepID=A0A8T2RVI9_CERRI|nr:hypothetical protein KP509_24G022100 [Ceratopteris richardii]